MLAQSLDEVGVAVVTPLCSAFDNVLANVWTIELHATIHEYELIGSIRALRMLT